ncbi:MAG TPA: ABC transporter permease [Bacillales bacterium]|nr:ABC transporter permease [Bacillales bacterium]
MNLLISLRSEILKTKRTAALYLAFITGTFGLLIYMLDLISDGVPPDSRAIIFDEMMTDKFQVAAFLMFPLFIVLTCTLLPQIEYKNNTWKQVLASPQPKWMVFVSKFLNVQLLIVVFLFTDLLMMFLGAVILHFIEPTLDVLNQPVDVKEIFRIRAIVYVALLAMCALQFWLGLRMKNFITPIGIGIALWITGTILVSEVEADFAEYFPYSYHVITNFSNAKLENNNYLWFSLGYAVLFLVLGFLDFRRNRIST